MNSMAQHAVPNGIGHSELARAQFTRKSSRVVTQPSLVSTRRRSSAVHDAARVGTRRQSHCSAPFFQT